MKRGCKAALWLAAACALSAGATEPQRHQREGVLGTSFEMIVVDAAESQVEPAVTAALAAVPPPQPRKALARAFSSAPGW